MMGDGRSFCGIPIPGSFWDALVVVGVRTHLGYCKDSGLQMFQDDVMWLTCVFSPSADILAVTICLSAAWSRCNLLDLTLQQTLDGLRPWSPRAHFEGMI